MLKNLKLSLFVLSICILAPFFYKAGAAENAPAGSQIGCANLQELSAEYFKDNRYNKFVEFLGKDKDKLDAGCISYYQALSRYKQLKYLEENQLWDAYFADGNTYREQILENAKKAIAETDTSSPLRPKSRLLLWQFYRDQQNTYEDPGLNELTADLKAYAEAANEPGLIKDIADTLLASDEKSGARAIYKLYVTKLASGDISDSGLKEVGAEFYKNGNLELSESVYDIYIERVSKKLTPEQLTPELFEIAGLFVYKPAGLYDMAYAERVYAMIEGLGQENSFNQEAIYLRALNLEKLMDYKSAAKFYSQLVELYPDTKHFDEAVYKLAMINAYALADIKKAKEYFEKLTLKTEVSSQVISSFYQLGLLAQWEADLPKAKDYYETLLKSAGDKYAESASQAKDRLKEIEDNKELSYNLKVFMDAVLKNENTPVELGSSELKASSFILEKGQKVMVSALANMPESGCNQVQLQYLWSGNLGGALPLATESGFEGSYSDAGTKEINMVVLSPGGITDIAFALIDVYDTTMNSADF